MKHIKCFMNLILITVVIFVLSGCVNSTYNLTLKNDGSLDVNFIVLYDSSKTDETINSFIDEMKRQFTDIGYTIKEKTELGMNGFEITKANIPPIGDGFVENPLYNIDILDDIMYNMEFDEKARCNEYELDGNIDLTGFSKIPEAIAQTTTQEEYTKILSDMHLKLVINLEDGEIKSTNSKKLSADKKTAEWILIPGSSNHVELQSVMGVNSAWKASMAVVAIVFIFIILFMLLLTKMYKKRFRADE